MEISPLEAINEGAPALAIAIAQQQQATKGLKLIQMGVQGLVQENAQLKQQLEEQASAKQTVVKAQQPQAATQLKELQHEPVSAKKEF